MSNGRLKYLLKLSDKVFNQKVSIKLIKKSKEQNKIQLRFRSLEFSCQNELFNKNGPNSKFCTKECIPSEEWNSGATLRALF